MRVLGIFVALCCLMAAGCSRKHKTLEAELTKWGDDVTVAARHAVDDPLRAAEAGRIADELTAELKLFFTEIEVQRKHFQRLNSHYDTSRSEFEAIYNKGRRIRKDRARKLVRLTMEMRAQMTPEEWSRFVAKTEPPAPK